MTEFRNDRGVAGKVVISAIVGILQKCNHATPQIAQLQTTLVIAGLFGVGLLFLYGAPVLFGPLWVKVNGGWLSKLVQVFFVAVISGIVIALLTRQEQRE